MDVVPVVIGLDVLLAHVALVNGQGGGEGLCGASVIAEPKVDVPGHVDHVAGGGGQATQDVGAVERLFGVVAGFQSVNVVVVGGGVVGIVFQHGFEDGERVLAAGIGEEDARLEVLRVIGDDFAQKLLFARVERTGIGTVRGLVVGGRGVDVEPLPLADVLLQRDGLRERLAGEPLGGAVVEGLGLVEAPVAHGTLGVDPHALFEGASGLVIPEVVQQVESLVEPHLSFRGGGDLHVGVADPGHPDRRRQFFGRDLVLHFHDMAGHVHLGERCREGRDEERQGENPGHYLILRGPWTQ